MSKKIPALEFLKKNKGKWFTVKEICNETKTSDGMTRQALAKLRIGNKEKKLFFKRDGNITSIIRPYVYSYGNFYGRKIIEKVK